MIRWSMMELRLWCVYIPRNVEKHFPTVVGMWSPSPESPDDERKCYGIVDGRSGVDTKM